MVFYIHLQSTAFRPDNQRLIAHPAHQVDRLGRPASQSQFLDIGLQSRLHRRTQFLLDRKEPVRRTQPIQPLVRPLVIIILNPPADPFPGRLEVRKLCPHQELLPYRLPEPLDFPKRHRMVRRAPDMMHPVFLQLPHEGRAPAPAYVLPPVVRKHFTRYPIGAHATPIHLQHVLAGLAPEDLQGRDIPRMVVDKPDQVGIGIQQLERKNIALP